MVVWSQKPQRPVLGTLSQGTIFSCARAEDYPACAVRGLTITARCDVAHEKTRIFSYLPVVSLRDWWHMDGLSLLLDRAQREQMSSLRDTLKTAGHSDSILSVHSPRLVVDTLFPETNVGAQAKVRTRALAIVDAIEEIGSCQLPATTDRLAKLCSTFSKLRRVLMDELLKGKLAGFYFLPMVEFDGPDDGFVVLLREVRHLPRSVARAVGAGLVKPLDESGLAALTPHLSFAGDDFAMPIGQLPSPLTEHVMQSFTILFSRIGLEDLPTVYLSEVWERLDIEKKAKS